MMVMVGKAIRFKSKHSFSFLPYSVQRLGVFKTERKIIRRNVEYLGRRG